MPDCPRAISFGDLVARVYIISMNARGLRERIAFDPIRAIPLRFRCAQGRIRQTIQKNFLMPFLRDPAHDSTLITRCRREKKNVRRRAPLDFISRKKSAIHKGFLHFVKKYSEKSR